MPEQESTSDLSNKASGAVSQVKGSVTDAANTAKEKVGDLGQKATNTIDSNRDSAASMLHTAATSLHDSSSKLPGGEKVTGLAHDTAHKLEASADYVRSHDSKAMMADLESFVKSHPGQSLIAAGVIGFLAGRAFSSND